MPEDDLEYDEKALLNDLKVWWDDQIGGGEDDPFAMPKPAEGTIFDVLPTIDSLGVVSGLITIEKYVGFKIPPHVIRQGGYSSFDELSADLLQKVKALVEKRKQKPTKAPKKEAA